MPELKDSVKIATDCSTILDCSKSKGHKNVLTKKNRYATVAQLRLNVGTRLRKIQGLYERTHLTFLENLSDKEDKSLLKEILQLLAIGVVATFVSKTLTSFLISKLTDRTRKIDLIKGVFEESNFKMTESQVDSAINKIVRVLGDRAIRSAKKSATFSRIKYSSFKQSFRNFIDRTINDSVAAMELEATNYLSPKELSVLNQSLIDQLTDQEKLEKDYFILLMSKWANALNSLQRSDGELEINVRIHGKPGSGINITSAEWNGMSSSNVEFLNNNCRKYTFRDLALNDYRFVVNSDGYSYRLKDEVLSFNTYKNGSKSYYPKVITGHLAHVLAERYGVRRFTDEALKNMLIALIYEILGQRLDGKVTD